MKKMPLLPPTKVAYTLGNTALGVASGGKLAGETPVGVAVSVIVTANETEDSSKIVIRDSVSNSVVGDKDKVATTLGLLGELGAVLVSTTGVTITSVVMTGATVEEVGAKQGSQGVTFMFRGPGD